MPCTAASTPPRCWASPAPRGAVLGNPAPSLTHAAAQLGVLLRLIIAERLTGILADDALLAEDVAGRPEASQFNGTGITPGRTVEPR